MEGFKIDLKSLKDHHDRKEELDKVNESEKASSLKDAEKSTNKKEVSDNKDKETKIDTPTPKINLSAIKPDSKKEENKDDNKKTKLDSETHHRASLSGAELNSPGSSEGQKNDSEGQEEEDKEVFKKYKSEFVKNRPSIMERIKKLKQLAKTRVGFLITIITLTAILIAILFKFFPEKHSVKIYKDFFYGALNIEQNNTEIIKKEERIEPKTSSGGQIKGQVQKEKSTIRKGGIQIEYESKTINGEDVIIYNGETYDSKEEFENSLDQVINKIQKDRLSDFLKNNPN